MRTNNIDFISHGARGDTVMQPISKLAKVSKDNISAQRRFRKILTDHLSTFVQRSDARLVTPEQAQSNTHSFYALLFELNIPYELHWLTLRINKYNDPLDYDGRELILVPDQELFNSLKNRYLTQTNVV